MFLDPEGLVLDISSLTTGSNTGQFEIDCRNIGWELEDLEPVSEKGILRLDVNYREKNLICRGKLEAVFSTSCARCLAPAVFPVSEDIFAHYSSEPVEEGDDPSIRAFSGGRQLCILDAVREAVILSVPGKPLCREDCRGLCHVCGANLNEETCAHPGPAESGIVR